MRGEPVINLPAKRPNDVVAVQTDWHDFLARLWEAGQTVASTRRIRPRRANATGFEYECTTAGQTGTREPVWPRTLAATITDGSAVWTARAISNSSLRATITTSTWTGEDGISLSSESSSDLVYTTYCTGGTHGETYEIRHKVVLSVGNETKEALLLLPVAD